VLGSFLVSLSSHLAILFSLLSRSPSVCQVITEYLYSLSPAIALYQVLVVLHRLLEHLCHRASRGKIQIDNPNTTGSSATTVIRALADLSEIICFTPDVP
jgi:hypothetical protein